MTRPEDIPENEDKAEILRAFIELTACGVPSDVQELLMHGNPALGVQPNAFARALLAYGQRRAEEATERAAKVCDEAAVEADEFMRSAILADSKRNYASAHVTCKRLAIAIRGGK